MIRIIVRADDAALAANVGGSVKTTFKTFDLEFKELEVFLREGDKNPYGHRYVVGVEVVG